MKYQPIFLILILVAFAACSKPDAPREFIKAEVFLNPPVEYRSAPFYSLNDKLDTAELVRQINSFKAAGFGGCFLHSRGGLLTEYMGKDWWEAMDVAVRTSRQIGLKAWFYDEDKWPSGFAGGKIPLMTEDFHARCLSRIDKNDTISENGQVLFEDENFIYIIHKASMGNSWFNGTCYDDLFNPNMVKAFIDSAYAPYLERYKDEIGKTVPGIFTDEPQISPRVSDGKEGYISFSPFVLDKFKDIHGYGLIPNIPSLFDTIGDFKKIRYDYYQTLSRCFEENFTEQIGKYCAEKNAIFTGHLNGEETFSSAMINSGNSMVNYRHMQMPGMDQLGLHYTPLNIPKSVSGVANQYGIIRRMSESYGISGQNMNFEDRKWLLDWLTLNGINFIVPHLSSYSMKGERKRDYPPNFSLAQPYWKFNKHFEDYSARMCYVNTLGKYAAEIALIHPLESEYLGIENNCYLQYDHCLNELQKDHRNYDLLDEQILADIGKSENRSLEVGNMKYKLVVLPCLLVIRSSTLNILKEFYEAGGKILICGSYPEFVDGGKNTEAISTLKQISQYSPMDGFIKMLDETLPADYTVEGENSEMIWTHYRKVENGGILQLSNTSRRKEIDCQLMFRSQVGQIAIWNPETGQSMKLAHDVTGKINLHFAATQSWLVSFGKASEEANFDVIYSVPGKMEEITSITGPWKGKRGDPNALTLDFARYSTDNGKSFSNPEPVIGIHQRLTRDRFNGKLLLKFEVNVVDVPSKCSLVAEQPNIFHFSVNGNDINFKTQEYYRDHSFKAQNISGTLKSGQNDIVMSVNYISPQPRSFKAIERYGTEIESVYLIGDFAVKIDSAPTFIPNSQKYHTKLLVKKPVYSAKSFSITKEDSLFQNDLVLQGYPFYAGDFVLKNQFNIGEISDKKNYFLAMNSFEAIVVKVKINGKEFDPMIFSPWRVDITEAIKKGENQIELELTNSLRNLLGPHHHKDGELIEVGPASYTGSPVWPNEGGESNWFDLRKSGKTSLWNDEYCLIPFGLLKEPIVLLEEAAVK